MLGTSSDRTWALKVYLDFGFYPDPAEMKAKPEVAANLETSIRLTREAASAGAKLVCLPEYFSGIATVGGRS